MVKCTKRQVRHLNTALRWKGDPERRQRIQMVLLRESAVLKLVRKMRNRFGRVEYAYEAGPIDS